MDLTERYHGGTCRRYHRIPGKVRTRREETAIKRDQAVAVLTDRLEELRGRFGVRRLSLFGSIARDTAGPGSDIDVLVEFAGKPTFDGYMDLKFALEDWLGCDVDLVTVAALKPRLAENIEREAIRVA